VIHRSDECLSTLDLKGSRIEIVEDLGLILHWVDDNHAKGDAGVGSRHVEMRKMGGGAAPAVDGMGRELGATGRALRCRTRRWTNAARMHEAG
jgi:hypothetical protein